MGQNKELRSVVMEACLDLTKQALVIFDAMEAGPVTMDAARAVVAMGNRANDIAHGVQALALTEG